MKDQLKFDAAELEAAYGPIKDFLQGKGDLPSGPDALTEDASGTELQESAVGEMSDATDSASKLKAMYAMAMARDAMYAMAGRKFLKSLGSHNHFRIVYETQKQAVLA